MGRSAHRSRRVARRRTVAVLLAATIGVVTWVLVAHWPNGSTSPAATTGGASTTGSSTPTTSGTTTTSDPPAIGTYGVATTTLQLVEPPAGGLPARTLPTAIWYPHAKGAPGSAPDRAGGPYPLLVFSQGYRAPVTTYATLLTDWASAGFVVAAPTYPYTVGPTPTVNEYDIEFHPQDLRFVIGQLVTRATHPGWVLSGAVDTSAMGVVGQSDGGDVSLAVAANSQWQDPAVKAVAVLSGAENTAAFGGSYFTGPAVPILVVQSNTDTVNVPACSAMIYNAAAAPKYYLKLLGPTTIPTIWENHLWPYTQLPTYEAAIAAVTAEFFHGQLGGSPSATAAMAANATPTVSQLSSGPTAPTPTGTCIGA